MMYAPEMVRGERFNAITHIAGTVLAVAGTSVILTLATLHGGARRITACAIYGAMLVLLYVSSTLYHSLHGRAKRVFHVFDHCAIYLLIAGTYTPFTLVTLRGPVGWSLFAVVWLAAIAGVVKDALLHGKLRGLSVALYIAMGWVVVIAFNPLSRALPASGIALLIAGGVVYTVGIAFYAMSKRIAWSHGIWHLHVIAGSALHYLVVARFVA
jgi:hemolysin III